MTFRAAPIEVRGTSTGYRAQPTAPPNAPPNPRSKTVAWIPLGESIQPHAGFDLIRGLGHRDSARHQ